MILLLTSHPFIIFFDPFWVNFCVVWERTWTLLFCVWIARHPSTIYWKDCLLHVEFFCHPLKNLLACKYVVYFWILSFVNLVWISCLMSTPHCFHYCSFAVLLRSGNIVSPRLFWLFRVPEFSCDFWDSFCVEASWGSHRPVIEPLDELRNVDILAVVSLELGI